MKTRKRPTNKYRKASAGVSAKSSIKPSLAVVDLDAATSAFQSALVKNVSGNNSALTGLTSEQVRIFANEASKTFKTITEKMQTEVLPGDKEYTERLNEARSHQSLNSIAENMQQSLASLGSALANMPTPVSPQLARATAATEQAWRDLENEFGLLTSTEVSDLVGSDSPNRSYASSQHSQGKLIAVKRPKGLRYPGYQFDSVDHAILPVIEKLISVAEDAGRSESSLALWMTRPTGYLAGDRPVDWLTDPSKVVEIAKQSFGVQW